MAAPAQPYTGPRADVGVLGGSGLYSFFEEAEEVEIATPWGPPSDTVTVGSVEGRRVAFVPRHGRDHRFPPHRMNYRANLWALRMTGVRQVLAPCAVGSLRPELVPGTFVVPDQLVDRTWGREHTVYGEVGPVVHVGLSDPYCPHGRAAVLRVAGQRDLPSEDGGTLVVVNGPRFSTRAESRWHSAQGWSVVGMTGAPESSLARELALCYTAIAVVTDLDAGVETGHGVTQAEVFAVFSANIDKLRALLAAVIPALPPAADDCPCRHALDGLTLPLALP